MKYDDDLWWKIIAVITTLTLSFITIWATVHPAPPQTPVEEARDSYTAGCNIQMSGTPNVGSDNPKEWTCQTK